MVCGVSPPACHVDTLTNVGLSPDKANAICSRTAPDPAAAKESPVPDTEVPFAEKE